MEAMKGLKENWLGYVMVFALSTVSALLIYFMNNHHASALDFDSRFNKKADIEYVDKQDKAEETMRLKQRDQVLEIVRQQDAAIIESVHQHMTEDKEVKNQMINQMISMDHKIDILLVNSKK